MYCPRCSQPSADELRFCPSCGLPLAHISELIVNNGVPAGSNGATLSKFPLMRRRGFRVGAKAIFISLFLIPLALMLSIVFDSPGPLIIPALVFLVGVATALYTVLFVDPPTLQSANLRPMLQPMVQPELLPSKEVLATANAGRRTNTAEMRTPFSVTDHTTQLLNEKPLS